MGGCQAIAECKNRRDSFKIFGQEIQMESTFWIECVEGREMASSWPIEGCYSYAAYVRSQMEGSKNSPSACN